MPFQGEIILSSIIGGDAPAYGGNHLSGGAQGHWPLPIDPPWRTMMSIAFQKKLKAWTIVAGGIAPGLVPMNIRPVRAGQ